jgi:cysteinyl-tRNA synthetase
MDDDVNTPAAVAVLSDLVRWTNTYLSGEKASRAVLEEAAATFERLGGDVLGIVTAELLGEEESGGALEGRLVELLIALRAEMRGAKNFAAADRIRKGLSDIGVELMDGPGGTTWRRA